MGIYIDYANIRIPILKFDFNKGKKKWKYPIANNVSPGSIVTTEHFLDIGFVYQTDNRKPLNILSRCDKKTICRHKGMYPQYGGINTVTWYDTGINISLEEWIFISDDYDAKGFYEYWINRISRKR